MATTSFYLRGIDLVGLVEKYLQGQFTQLTNVSSLTPSSSLVSERHIVSIKSNTGVRNHETTNESGRSFIHVGYRIKEGGKYGEIGPGEPARCMYCLINVEFGVGIPIAKEKGSHLRAAYGIDTIYRCIDIFCGFPCLLAELRKRLSYRKEIYEYSMTYLSEMYELTTGEPFINLKPSPDQRLLKIFNGDLDYPEFHSDLKYSAKPENLFYLPVIQKIEKDT